MDLSRRDAFRPCSRDSSGDKVNFVLLAKKKTFLIGIGPPLLPNMRIFANKVISGNYVILSPKSSEDQKKKK